MKTFEINKVAVASVLILTLALPLGTLGNSRAAASNWPDVKPVAEGPVEYDDRVCLRFYRYGAGQKFCAFWYNWQAIDVGPPPAIGEFNPVQDFGVIWMQNFVDSGNGLCVFDARVRLTIPADYGLLERTPSRTIETKKPRAMITEHVTDADGWSVMPATFKNKEKWTLYPDRLDQPVEREGLLGSRVFEWRWHGYTGQDLTFATGLTFNWFVPTGLLFETVFGIPPVQAASPTSLAAFQDCDLPPPERSPLDDLEVESYDGQARLIMVIVAPERGKPLVLESFVAR